MSTAAQHLLKAAPWLERGATTTNPRGQGQPKARPSRKGTVTPAQYHDAKVLAERYNYVISVDDELVPANHQRSALVIGLGNVIPANDNQEVKAGKGRAKKTA
jgi:hypothetical protein